MNERDKERDREIALDRDRDRGRGGKGWEVSSTCVEATDKGTLAQRENTAYYSTTSTCPFKQKHVCVVLPSLA